MGIDLDTKNWYIIMWLGVIFIIKFELCLFKLKNEFGSTSLNLSLKVNIIKLKLALEFIGCSICKIHKIHDPKKKIDLN